jgi:hypothetical protein
MNRSWCDLGEWDQNEPAQVKPGMRDSKERAFDSLIPEKEQVEINGPRSFQRFVAAAKQVFDTKHAGHKLRGSNVSHADLSDHIEKIHLALYVHRFGFVDRRKFPDLDARFEKCSNRQQQISGPVAKV